jgi:hypothetical protein
MNTKHNTLKLRTQSIRTLTAELGVVAGGDGGNGPTKSTKRTTAHTMGSRRTKTKLG